MFFFFFRKGCNKSYVKRYTLREHLKKRHNISSLNIGKILIHFFVNFFFKKI